MIDPLVSTFGLQFFNLEPLYILNSVVQYKGKINALLVYIPNTLGFLSRGRTSLFQVSEHHYSSGCYERGC